MNIKTKVIIGVIVVLVALAGILVWRYKAAFYPQASVVSYQPATWPYSMPGPGNVRACLTSPYVKNSSITASPLTVRANNKDEVTVKIIVRDDNGRAVRNLPVFVTYTTQSNTDPQLRQTYAKFITDYRGTAIFKFTAKVPGKVIFRARTPAVILRRQGSSIEPEAASYPSFCDEYLPIDNYVIVQFVK